MTCLTKRLKVPQVHPEQPRDSIAKELMEKTQTLPQSRASSITALAKILAKVTGTEVCISYIHLFTS